MVFDSGDQLGSPDVIPLSKVVDPGETVDIQVLLLAPMEPRTYTGYWMLRDLSGLVFGSGENADQPFSVTILVEEVQENKRLKALDCGG